MCACCDELCKKAHEVHITEEWVELLKQRLPWMTEVPASLRDQYNVAKVDARLSSLASVPLSPRGVICGDARRQSRLSFCDSCYRSIRRSSQRTPPKFSIANGWEIGDPPPCFTEATWAEVKMISLASVSANIKVIGRDRIRRKLHSQLWRSSTLLGPRLPTFHRRSSRRTFKLCFQMLLQKTWTSPRRSSFACEESRSNRWQRLRRRTTRLMQEQPGFKGSILSTRIRSWSTSAVSANIKVIGRVRIRRKLHSHTMAFINAPGPALTYLSQTIKQEDFQVVFSNATAEDVDLAKKKFVRVRREQIEQMAAFATKNNSAYAGATRLQGVIDSLDEDSILVNLCAMDDRALIKEVINDSSRVNTGIDETSTSIMETSGGLFNLTPEPLPPPPDDDGGSADEEGDPSPLRKFQVQRSNVLLGSRDAEFYGAAFPEFTKKWS